MTSTIYIFDQGLKGLVGHYYEYVRSIVEAAEAAGMRCVVGCHEEAGAGSFASFDVHPVFRDDVWATMPGAEYQSAANMSRVSERFLEDMNKILARHPVQPGDIVFMPNIARPHLVAASRLPALLGPAGARVRLMFRYPRAEFDGPAGAEAFRRIAADAGRYDVELYTDSHRLAGNLAELSSLPFRVLPIPHTRAAPAAAVEAAREGPLHCVSLGNARDEKGLAEILEAIRLTSHEPWAAQLRFTLQVNDPYQVEDAIEAFKAGPPDPRTTLIDEPLSSDAYESLLASADVVLVPYWRSIYRERTSGVFLEALIAGKLVLCTRDTWMSDLLAVHGGGVAIPDRSAPAIAAGLRRLIEKREQLQETARAAADYWSRIHSAENVVAHLAGEKAVPVPQPNARKGKAAVLFPWGEAVAGKTGASLRLNYFVRFMESIYDEVRILFAGQAEQGGIIGERSISEPAHYSDGAKLLHKQLKEVCKSVGAPAEDCFHLWYHLWPGQDELFALQCEKMVMWADHVYVDYTYFVPLAETLCRKYGKPFTVTLHDIVSEQAAGTPFLYGATRTLELDAARRAQRLICASEADRDLLAAAAIEAEVIPHPIDTHEAKSPFSPEEARAILSELYDMPVAGKRICFFVGSNYPPNNEAAESIAEMAERSSEDPRLRDVLFVVAGGCMAPTRDGNFVALGMIEGAALSACMALADVVLIPLRRGTGVSLKSIEALARGSAIVSTSVGMRGVDVEDGVHCHIENDLSLFPERIAEILGDERGTDRMREAARAFGARFDFRRVMSLYVPGSDPLETVETDEEFEARRQQAIAELLPRLRKAGQLSPLLAQLELRAGAAVETAANPLAATTPGRVTPLPSLPDDFDADWYADNYPDVAMLGLDPAEHYLSIGHALGRPANGGKRGSIAASEPSRLDRAGRATSRGGRRWFLADPSLIDNSGHSARYLRSVAAALRARGEAVQVFGNRNVRNDIADLADCEPCFSLPAEALPVIPNLDPTSASGQARIHERTGELLRQDLDALSARHSIGRSDLLLINSLRHWSIEGVVRWLESRGAARAPDLALILHYAPFARAGVQDAVSDAYRDAFRLIEKSPLRSRIHLFTDSERLRDEYRTLSDLPITVVPIPHSGEPTADALRDSPAEAQTLSIAFAGEARTAKGFDLLPAAVSTVLANPLGAQVLFDIQAYDSSGARPSTASSELPIDPRVRIYPKPLSDEEYDAFIAGADLILLPYLKGHYQAQTSGVYCEAAAAGIPVVVPADTWMADQVAQNGGGVLFDAGDARSLAEACLVAIQTHAELREAARAAAAPWRAFHNSANFVECLEQAIDSTSGSRAA